MSKFIFILAMDSLFTTALIFNDNHTISNFIFIFVDTLMDSLQFCFIKSYHLPISLLCVHSNNCNKYSLFSVHILFSNIFLNKAITFNFLSSIMKSSIMKKNQILKFHAFVIFCFILTN